MPIPPRDRSRLRRTPRDAAEEDKSSYAPEYSPRNHSASRFDDLAAEKIRRQHEGFAFYQGGPMGPPPPEMFGPPHPQFQPHPAVPPMFMPFQPAVDVRALSPPRVRVLSPPPPVDMRALVTLSPPRMHPTSPQQMQAEQQWLVEEERARASVMVAHETQQRVIRSAIAEDLAPLPRQVEKHDEAMMMARWAQLVESRVEGTERSLAAATQGAQEAGRAMRMREALAEREKELSHENMLRDVENAKASAESERRTAFEGRVYTTKLEQHQAEELAHQREYFERDMLDREKRHRDAQAGRRDQEEAWRLRRKDREDDQRESERVDRAGKHKLKATEDLSRAEDLHRVADALDQAHKARELALAYREAERDDQRRQRMRREAELEAANREEAELADNMISNLDRAYREQEQAAALVREADSNRIESQALFEESNTRAPFRAARAQEHQKLLTAISREEMEEVQRDNFHTQMTTEDFERRMKAEQRIHRGLDGSIGLADPDQRQLRQFSSIAAGQPGGSLWSQNDHTRRAKLGSEARDTQSVRQESMSEANNLANRYAAGEYTLHDAAANSRPRPEHAHVHHFEEYDFSHTAAGAAGPTPLQDRPLHYEYHPEGRIFAGVQGPREEMEVARAAKKALERQERITAIEAARTKREEAEYTYAARKVHYSQLQARHEQLLGEATPALAAAQTAAASLSEGPVLELFNAPDPSPAVRATVNSVQILLTNTPAPPTYEQARQRLQYAELFVNDLRSFNCDNVSEGALELVSSLMRQLDVDEVLIQSPVSATLLLWVANICRYNEIYRLVRPVRMEMQTAAMALEEMDEARRVAAKKLAYTLAWRE